MAGRCMYDFQGDASQNELSFQEGDSVVITDMNVGDGWWQGCINGGPPGLIPASYVELQPGAEVVPPTQEVGGDEDDDGWDEDSDGGSDFAEGPEEADGDDDDSASRSSSDAKVVSRKGGGVASGQMSRSATMKRSVNRFSAFVKAGAEGFMIGDFKKDLAVKSSEHIHIIGDNQGISVVPMWQDLGNKWGEITVTDGGKVKKTLSSYSAYNIQSQRHTVKRGFRHFQWLHDRLCDKFSCICVPPLPDKTYSPKYGEDYSQKRMLKLKLWLQRVARHPVLVNAKAFEHFLTCDEKHKSQWKDGKRAAEKDEIVGPNFFRVIQTDLNCPRDAVKKVELFGSFQQKMSKGVHKCQEIAQTHAKRMAGAISKEYSVVGQGFKQLSEVFKEPGDGDSIKLSMAVQGAAVGMENMAQLWKNQPILDQIPWMDGLTEYGNMLTQFSDAVQSSKEADAKVKHLSKNVSEEEADLQADKQMVEERGNVIHMVTLCEVSHFHKQRCVDFKKYFLNYLQAQKEFHLKMIEKLEAAEQQFSQLPF
eukprot:m.335081 g.335081  ORF g.335081 m.335081 type:complete len:534 (+) comp17510_c0_seq1:180-1781(+)